MRPRCDVIKDIYRSFTSKINEACQSPGTAVANLSNSFSTCNLRNLIKFPQITVLFLENLFPLLTFTPLKKVIRCNTMLPNQFQFVSDVWLNYIFLILLFGLLIFLHLLFLVGIKKILKSRMF